MENNNAIVAGFVVCFLGLLVFLSVNKPDQAAAIASRGLGSGPAAATTSKKKKKKKKKSTAAKAVPATPVVVVEPEVPDTDSDDSSVEEKKAVVVIPDPVVIEEKAPEAETNGKKKKKKKKKAGAAVVEEPKVETPPPRAPTPPPPPPVVEEEAPPATNGKKKKKKKKKKAAAETNGNAPETNGTTNGNGAAYEEPKQEEDGGGWSTINKRSKKSTGPVIAKSEGGSSFFSTIALDANEVPLLIGSKGATVQRLATESGAKIDIDKMGNGGVAKMLGTEQQVAKASKLCQDILDEDRSKKAAATAFSATLSGKDIKGENGVKAVVGKGGVTIQNIQAQSGCKLNASIDTGSVSITGPTQEGVDMAVKMCKIAVFGETATSVDLKSQSMVLSVCGKGFSQLRAMQEESGARLDFAVDPKSGRKTVLEISGDKEKVEQAKAMIMARMAAVAGITMDFDASQIGAIYGKGGMTLRHIQDKTGTAVEVLDATQSGTGTGVCKILGDADAVKAAQTMILKALAGEVELKAGEVLEKVDCGVGAAAVIGRGGSKIAELEAEFKVKLNLQSGSGECSIVGKKSAVTAATAAIEAIVNPLKEKAIEEAKVRAAAEELAASGDDTWGTVDGADAWNDVGGDEAGW